MRTAITWFLQLTVTMMVFKPDERDNGDADDDECVARRRRRRRRRDG